MSITSATYWKSRSFSAFLCNPLPLARSLTSGLLFSLTINHLALRHSASRECSALTCSHESPSHPPGAKDHVSGILDPSAGRNSGEVVAENWNSVPHGK